jgi:putative FmdB family regulatory protein
VPIYEYVCRECDRRFEVIVNGAAKPKCPGCGAARLDKQLSVFAVGASGSERSSSPAPGPCGTCGDPRGPGSCALD